MKKLLFLSLSLLCFSGVFAQDKSVAVVRHVNWLNVSDSKQHQYLLISRPNAVLKKVELKQTSIDFRKPENFISIEFDDQQIISEFTSLLTEGYKLVTSNTSSYPNASGPSGVSSARETIYIFVKD